MACRKHRASRRRYRPEHVTPAEPAGDHASAIIIIIIIIWSPLGRTLAYVALLKHHCEDFSTHGTYPICNTVDPFAKKNLGTKCALRTRHYSRIGRLTGYWAQICNPLFHFDIFFLDVDPLRSARRTRHGSQVYLIMCGAILQLQVEDQWTLS